MRVKTVHVVVYKTVRFTIELEKCANHCQFATVRHLKERTLSVDVKSLIKLVIIACPKHGPHANENTDTILGK